MKSRTVKQQHVIPGFGLTLGFTLTYAGLLILLPLAGFFHLTAQNTWQGFISKAILNPRVIAAYRLSFTSAAVAAAINTIFGGLLAWVFVRYRFPGRRLGDALVDLPFALPTAVSGIALTTLYAPKGWLGQWLVPLGVRVAYAPLGIILALTLIGLPFVVRTVQPALLDLEGELEEAAASLGASRGQTFFRVILPAITPALISGFTLAFARAVGEFGSVYFIAGNMPMRTEIAPLLILIKLEQYDYPGAAAIGTIMLLVSFLLLLTINFLQTWSSKRRTN
jgi:sulfate transport system permease protein